MNIGLHDSDATDFPNYALMKISAWHKAQGDNVEWWNPLMTYDRVYSSKVFTFTPENPYLPENTIKGGTGYGLYNELPPEIDDMFPDYSIYPKVDYAIGFLTRGCKGCTGIRRTYRGANTIPGRQRLTELRLIAGGKQTDIVN